jgi:predicted nucleic acid-binding protein
MHRALYDTRFFTEFYYSRDEKLLKRMRKEQERPAKFVSVITIHEVYKLSLKREGRDNEIENHIVEERLQIVPVDDLIATVSAELSQKYNLSMGNSMIAATASTLKAVCISDDPHFRQIEEIKTSWI